LKQRRVAQLDLKTGAVIQVFPSVRAAARTMGGNYSHSSITKTCKGYYQHGYGYGWRYLEENDRSQVELLERDVKIQFDEINRLRGLLDMLILYCPKCTNPMEVIKKNRHVCHSCKIALEQRTIFQEYEKGEVVISEERAEFAFYVRSQIEHIQQINPKLMKKDIAAALGISAPSLNNYEVAKYMPKDKEEFYKRLEGVRKAVERGEM